MSAIVHAINVSNGGVPKLARMMAWIGAEGMEGDRQRHSDIHGGPLRAVCLYSLQLIQALRAEGHPIAPGTIGENLTLDGIDWAAMLPGAQLEVGDALLELTSYTAPCMHIRHSFHDEAFVRVSQKVHPGWSRLYARVLQPGHVTVGAPAILLPPPHVLPRSDHR